MAVVELKFKITDLTEERAQVQMVTSAEIGVGEISLAAQYIMWIYTKESGLPFEEALRRLCDGARTFKDVRKLEVLPEKRTLNK